MPTTDSKTIKAAKLRPRADWGFFGPDSPTWKVWTAPTALIGFQRAVVVEHFDPFLAAAVADSAGIAAVAGQEAVDGELDESVGDPFAGEQAAVEERPEKEGDAGSGVEGGG